MSNIFFDTLLFFIFLFVGLTSIMGFGRFFNIIFISDNKYYRNQFNLFFMGLVFLIPFSFFYNIIIGNNYLCNLLIILFGFYYLNNTRINELKINFFLFYFFYWNFNFKHMKISLYIIFNILKNLSTEILNLDYQI